MPQSNFKNDIYQITLVIPSYCESERLPNYLGILAGTIPRDMKLIIVDDGSPEQEFLSMQTKIAKYLSHQVELMRYEKNKGKGGAIEFGLENAKTPWLGFLDADGSIPAHEVNRLWSLAKEENRIELLMSSRKPAPAYTVVQDPVRKILRKIFVSYLRLLFRSQIHDSQCGYKIFSRNFYQESKEHLMDKGWLWDTELVILAQTFGKKILEIPIDWSEKRGSKMHVCTDSIRMLRGLWRFKKKSQMLKRNL